MNLERIIDISRPLLPGIAVWPGDTPFTYEQTQSRAQGDAVNLTTLTMSAHTGTHVDAPHHYADNAPGIAALDLWPFWGAAQVVTVSKTAGPLTPADLAGVDLSRAVRLLVRTPLSVEGGLGSDPRTFPESFVYPSPELAQWLGREGIVLYGSDAPSMDAPDSKSLPGHLALRRAGIAILEWLDLSGVADGMYDLVALPLRLVGGDGSPVRAALRPLP
ncbi:MAG: cyclase family protein [Candidatus Promineifilaceae bacterium]|nr:cyclase family protein [Candidatus Promineifilaceae bacterium]